MGDKLDGGFVSPGDDDFLTGQGFGNELREGSLGLMGIHDQHEVMLAKLARFVKRMIIIQGMSCVLTNEEPGGILEI